MQTFELELVAKAVEEQVILKKLVKVKSRSLPTLGIFEVKFVASLLCESATRKLQSEYMSVSHNDGCHSSKVSYNG